MTTVTNLTLKINEICFSNQVDKIKVIKGKVLKDIFLNKHQIHTLKSIDKKTILITPSMGSPTMRATNRIIGENI